MTATNSVNQLPYTLESNSSCEPPYQSTENNWYQYNISQGTNTITGYKSGEYTYVIQSINANIERLNLRQKGKFGPLHTSTGSKK